MNSLVIQPCPFSIDNVLSAAELKVNFNLHLMILRSQLFSIELEEMNCWYRFAKILQEARHPVDTPISLEIVFNSSRSCDSGPQVKPFV